MGRNVLLLIVTVSLAAAVPAAAAPPDYPASPASIRAYHDSGRWDRDIKSVTDRARRWVKHSTGSARAPRRPAIVFDIDETSLDNYPCIERADFAATALATCVVAFDSPAIRHTRRLFTLAHRLRLAIFFVTGRPEGLREGTLRDLRDSGYRGKYTLLMRPNDYAKPSLAPYKTGARRRITRRGYKILANVGDQRSDLSGGFAERRYLIPNPMYRSP